ncbi:DUF3093 domain-containing protein [Falsarthrobacter nasiphocae]|uniref:DUF3093 domain-containing protein n=1 Tax=Falsarthrobacter nasiphocae TaxID=189863 RepID=A0AAE3YFW1_9MICC|nr:DUF3093 domain-containing protein [Falsarthrobacter nasiphocae]MDR6891266.1 hypothetical protein [Falsarthrobacter nasiphocae]
MTTPSRPRVLFAEKLRPSWWIWTFCAVFASAWILVFQPVSLGLGVVVGAAIFAALGIILIVTTPEVVVTESRVRAGRASIEPRHLARPEALGPEAATKARGTEFNALSYQCLRGWIQPLVRVQVVDPQDPTPSWLISSRRPNELAAALEQAAAADSEAAGGPAGR